MWDELGTASSRRDLLTTVGLGVVGLLGRVGAASDGGLGPGSAVSTSELALLYETPGGDLDDVERILSAGESGRVLQESATGQRTWWHVEFEAGYAGWVEGSNLARSDPPADRGDESGRPEETVDRTVEGRIRSALDRDVYSHVPGEDVSEIVLDLSKTGGSGDLDLYVTLDGRPPTTSDYDRRSYAYGSDESITIDRSQVREAIGIRVDSYWGTARYSLAIDERGGGTDEPGPMPDSGIRATFTRPPTSLGAMRDEIDEYASYGVTDLAVNTFYHGETIYPTDHTSQKPFPRNFLSETIAYAHRQGIRVHAWMQTLYLWNPKYLGDVPPDHLLAGSERVCAGNSCARLDEDTITETADGTRTAENGKVFGSPFDDDLVATLAALAREVDQAYDLDGVMLDYVRLPKSADPFGYGPSAGGWSTHDERVDAVTGVVDRVASAVTDATVSVDVFPSYYTSSATTERNKAQDWKRWRDETPVDVFVPMCYSYSSYDRQLELCDRLRTATDRVVPALAINDGHDGIATQYRTWDDYGFPGYAVWKGEYIDAPLPGYYRTDPTARSG